MKRLFGLIIVIALIVSGCGGENVQAQPPKTTTPFTPPTGDLATKTWISPGIVEVGNFYAGAEADWVMRVHNGEKEPSIFIITYKIPTHSYEGFSMPPSSAQLWVTIDQATPMIQPGETKEILINLKVPSGSKNLPAKWEFWVAVTQKSDAMLQTEMCSRWLITMR